jgi:negative regulator of replication initiation
MTTIEIDFDVFKALTIRRKYEEESYNDVLRELLELGPPKKITKSDRDIAQTGDWVVKGVRFPAETEFRTTIKGEIYHAVVKDGGLVLNGKKYNSPSLAGVSITDYAVNGWNIWECRMPGKSSWIRINTLRK